MTRLLSETDLKALRLEYLNAALQRSKKMPKFEELTRTGDRKPTLNEIAERFDLKPKG